MGILINWATVGSPTGVPNSSGSSDFVAPIRVKGSLEVGEFTGLLLYSDMPLIVDNGNTSGVIAAVFHAS